MKRLYITTLAVCLAILALFNLYFAASRYNQYSGELKVGFVYENDASAPYTFNFTLVQKALTRTFGDQVELLAYSNVLENETLVTLETLARKGCGIVFACTYSDQVIQAAEAFPETQFCQISCCDLSGQALPPNYHTFNAEMSKARYITGVAAGIQLRHMLDRGVIAPEEALLGFVGCTPAPDTISDFTAFLLGARSVAPEARMIVKYADTRCSYIREKACAEALIDAGCQVIAQNTHTIGPAAACEEACAQRQVYHIGYSQSMLDIAPAATLMGLRPNWEPYVTGAVQAVLGGQPIESSLLANVHGTDASAGMERDWVQLLELNQKNASADTQARLDQAADQLRRRSSGVFRGDYIGVDPYDPSDTIDLNKGFVENADSSYPSFHYLLKDAVEILD